MRKTHPDLSFKKTPLCLKMVWRGNHSPPASPVGPPSPHPPRASRRPPALGELVPGTALSLSALPWPLTPGWPPSWLQGCPFLCSLPRAPVCGSHHRLPGTGDNPLPGRMMSSSTGDDSGTRRTSGKTATASWNGYRCCGLAAVTEFCCLCLTIHPAFSSNNTLSLRHPSQSYGLTSADPLLQG